DAELRASVPTLPGDYVSLEVRGGFVLGMKLSVPRAERAHAEVTIALPRPRDLRVAVVDDKEAPVAGALVRHGLGLHYRGELFTELGRTDANGCVCRSAL